METLRARLLKELDDVLTSFEMSKDEKISFLAEKVKNLIEQNVLMDFNLKQIHDQCKKLAEAKEAVK